MGKEDTTRENLGRILEEYGRLRDEILFSRGSDFFENSDACYSGLQETAFGRFDEYDSEEEQEGKAVPLNKNQRLLVEYFQGNGLPSEGILEAFLKEKYAEDPNLPLLRKYFKRGNIHLKQLLLFGIQKCPVDPGLLDDLAFFHRFHGMLGELIEMYMKACRLEENPETFRTLAEDFYWNTIDDGFDALYELQQEFAHNSPKGAILSDLAEGRLWGE